MFEVLDPRLLHIRVVEARARFPWGWTDQLDGLPGDLPDPLIHADVADEPIIRPDRMAVVALARVQPTFRPAKRKSLVSNLINQRPGTR